MADTETVGAHGDNVPVEWAASGTESEPQPPSALASGLPASDSPAAVCRICYGEADDESGSLLMPCDCRGSMAFAHRLCMEVCLREWGSDRCKVCRAHITVRRKRAPLRQFFRDPENCKDLRRIANNTVAGTGDVIVLGLAWIYVASALEGGPCLVNLAVISFMLFLTAIWIVVEIVRVFVCYERVCTLWKKFITIELLPDGAYLASINSSKPGYHSYEDDGGRRHPNLC